MTCKEFDALLDSLREDRLTQEQRAAIDAHLASCVICRFKARALDDLRRLDEEEALPETFSAAWRQGIIAKEETPVKQFPRLTKFLALAASLLVLAGGTWLAGRERRQADTPRFLPATAARLNKKKAPAGTGPSWKPPRQRPTLKMSWLKLMR